MYSDEYDCTKVLWEGNAKFVKQLETVQMTAAKKILGCSKYDE